MTGIHIGCIRQCAITKTKIWLCGGGCEIRTTHSSQYNHRV